MATQKKSVKASGQKSVKTGASGKNVRKSTGTSSAKSGQKARAASDTKKVNKVTTPVKSTPIPEKREYPAVRSNNQLVSPGTEILIWVMLGFCIILCLANFFGIGGAFGRAISYFFFGLFGLIAYLIPFILFIGTAFIAVNIRSRSLAGKIAAFVLLLITLSCFCELITGDFDKNQRILAYFQTGADLHEGGGFFGGIICCIFCPFVGTIGTWICNIILFIISLICLTGQSAIDGIYNSSKRVVSSYQNNSDRKRMQNRREPSDDLQIRRNRIASGVSMDTKLSADTKVSDDVHEIIPNRNSGGKKKVLPVAEAPDIRFMDQGETTRAKKLVESLDENDRPGHQMEFPIQGVVKKTQEEEDKEAENALEDENDSGIRRSIKKNPRSSEKEQEKDKKVVEEEIRQNEKKPQKIYQFPSVRLLGTGSGRARGNSEGEVRDTAAKLQSTLESFGVNVTITNVSCGPAVTRYELKPEQGVKVSKIVNLSDDIKLNLAASDIRIEAPIPGKDAVGIEVPNKENSAVYLRELLETDTFRSAKSSLSFAVGKDIAGQPVITDIAKMPHLLIAGATGSGKSVCINTLIMSILYKANPEDVKLIMIDPKVVELSVYNGIPHLLIPVVTDPKKASGALNWAVAEMVKRYEMFSNIGVRDLAGYNRRVEAIPDGTEGKPEKLPQIVIIVDELADLMMVAPGEVEDAICRLAQLARAAGLHLIIATQRPSVNVITGLIKANMPSRIAFSVTSGVDSRTILDMNGAEKLLGKGDMLFYPQGYPKPVRIQGAFVTDDEVGRVTDFLKKNVDEELYGKQETIDIDKFSSQSSAPGSSSDGGSDRDPIFVDAGKFIIEKDKASIGMLQRVFKIGFNRAARIMDQLADAGVVGPEEGTKPRKILMSLEEFEQFIDEYY